MSHYRGVCYAWEYARCVDCDPVSDNLYYFVRGEGERIIFDCVGRHGELRDDDIYLEWNESWGITTHSSDSQLQVLTIFTHAMIEDDEDDDEG